MFDLHDKIAIVTGASQGIGKTIALELSKSGAFVNAITFGRDIVWRSRPKEAKKNPVYLIRRGLIAVSILSILLSITIPSVVKLFYTLGSIIIPGLIIPFINALTRKNNAINSCFSLLWLCVPVAVSLIWYILNKFSIELISNLEPFYPGILTSMIFYLILRLSSKDNRLIYDSMPSE